MNSHKTHKYLHPLGLELYADEDRWLERMINGVIEVVLCLLAVAGGALFVVIFWGV